MQHVDIDVQHFQTSGRPRNDRGRRRLRSAFGVLAAASLVLGAAGCGGDDDSAADTSDGDGTTSTEMSESMSESTDAPTSTMGSTDSTMASTVSDVSTDTMAGQGVDLFVTFLPIVGVDDELAAAIEEFDNEIAATDELVRRYEASSSSARITAVGALDTIEQNSDRTAALIIALSVVFALGQAG